MVVVGRREQDGWAAQSLGEEASGVLLGVPLKEYLTKFFHNSASALREMSHCHLQGGSALPDPTAGGYGAVRAPSAGRRLRGDALQSASGIAQAL